MESSEPKETSIVKSRQIIHIALQLLSLAFLIGWCFQILAPFMDPILWGAILAVALYPVHKKLKKILKGKGILAALIISGSIFILLIVIGIWLGVKTGSEIKTVVTSYTEGKLKIPDLPASVKGWPLIGNKVQLFWDQLASGATNIIQKYPDEVKSAASYFLALLATTGKAFLIFAVSIIISGVFLCYGDQSATFAHNVFNRLINSSKFDMASIAATTIRNVVRGILGVAFIQSMCAGVGFLVAGIPYAGIWALFCLILAIIQIGIFPIVVGVLIYIWTTGSTTTALLLTIWMIPVGLLDNILKPLMMGKGAPVPMLVIFLGSLGGFIYSGIVGLFTGAVILSLGYRLFDTWLKGAEI